MKLFLAFFALCVTGIEAVAQRQYKRVHQAAMRQVVDGKPAEAVTEMRKRLQNHPDDPETWYALAIAAAHTGDEDQAFVAMHRALRVGLPVARFVAGPRELTGLFQTKKFVEPVEGGLPSLLHGPMLGDVRADGFRVWIRTANADEFAVEVAPASGDSERFTGSTTADRDFTGVVNVGGLKPGSAYRYRVVVGDEKTPWQPIQTLAGKPSRFTLAFGGGSGFVPQHERAWDTIRGREPDLLVLLGDNIYSDDPKRPAIQRYSYYRRQSRPEFRKLIARTPVYAIWDDHDFGTNDCHGGPEMDTPAWKRPVWRTFTHNWVNPSYGGGEAQPGCWFRFRRDDVEFFMLDGRYYRTNPKLDETSMLGPVQERWLLDALEESDAVFKVVCSPVPWALRSKGNSKDTWNGFQAQRSRIFDFIDEKGIDGVVLMSADRHRSDAWRIDRGERPAFYEFNSSRLTNQHVHKRMPHALFSYNAKQSFGLVTFDTTLDDPTVTYRVIDIDNVEHHRLELRHSQTVRR